MTDQPPDKKPPLTPLRSVFGFFSVVLMLVGGLGVIILLGWSIWFIYGIIIGNHNTRDLNELIGTVIFILMLMAGGVALIGWLIWWAAMKRGR